jgi:hypothetical protein
MSGSETQQKTSNGDLMQLPLKGFSTVYKDRKSGHEFRIEGMGDGRYRVHSAKRQPKQK